MSDRARGRGTDALNVTNPIFVESQQLRANCGLPAPGDSPMMIISWTESVERKRCDAANLEKGSDGH
jgi:hypothetical protein